MAIEAKTTRTHRLERALEEILDALLAHRDPEKVILFGSLANGQVGEWSDLDLAVVMETDLPYYRRLREMALLCDYRVGVDFLVLTPEEFDRLSRDNEFFKREVLDRGKVVYERSAT